MTKNKVENIDKQVKDTQADVDEYGKLEQVIAGASLGYWDWNWQTGKHHVNERWLDMIGLCRDDETQHENDWSSRVNPEDHEIIMPVIKEHIETGGTYVVEFRMRHKKGHWVWIQGSGAVVEYDSNNKPLRLCGTHQDITERKKLENERDQLVESLQEALSEIKMLKGIIPICSYCHNIRDDYGAWDKLEAYLSKNTDAIFSHGICPKCLKKVLHEAGLDDEL